MAQKPESFEGIDFEAIKDATGLETDEIKVLKICFNMFDFKDQVRHHFFISFIKDQCLLRNTYAHAMHTAVRFFHSNQST